MKMIQKLKEIIDKHSQKMFYHSLNYSQFTFNMFKTYEDEMKDVELYERSSEYVTWLLNSMINEVKTIIDVIIDGNDKDIFCELLEDLNNINNK